MKIKSLMIAAVAAVVLSYGCNGSSASGKRPIKIEGFGGTLAQAAVDLTKDDVTYDASYFKIPYPNGDVPADKGVCADVVIRAYRKVGIDLQKLVHDDMFYEFDEYPNHWGLTKPDPNIDHRRVRNLMKFFERHGTIQSDLTEDPNPEDFVPGDIVCWTLGGGTTHIGIVSNVKTNNLVGAEWMMVHNVGSGQILDDCLFDYEIIGHYQYVSEDYYKK
jgi:uncharacterized protein YijF (DUF1287 family)